MVHKIQKIGKEEEANFLKHVLSNGNLQILLLELGSKGENPCCSIGHYPLTDCLPLLKQSIVNICIREWR